MKHFLICFPKKASPPGTLTTPACFILPVVATPVTLALILPSPLRSFLQVSIWLLLCLHCTLLAISLPTEPLIPVKESSPDNLGLVLIRFPFESFRYLPFLSFLWFHASGTHPSLRRNSLVSSLLSKLTVRKLIRLKGPATGFSPSGQ